MRKRTRDTDSEQSNKKVKVETPVQNTLVKTEEQPSQSTLAWLPGYTLFSGFFSYFNTTPLAPVKSEKEIRLEKQVAEYKLLDQDTLNKKLYKFEKMGAFARKLTEEQLDDATCLLKAGANPNYMPTKHPRMSDFKPISLIEAAGGCDPDFFNLLLEHDANLFRNTKDSNKRLCDLIAQTYMHPSNIKPYMTAIANKITEALGTTPDNLRTENMYKDFKKLVDKKLSEPKKIAKLG